MAKPHPTLPLMLNLELLLGALTRSALQPWNTSSPPSANAWPSWNNVWQNPNLPRPAPVPPHQLPALASAVEALLQSRLQAMLGGVQRYQTHTPHQPPVRDVVWRAGSSALHVIPPLKKNASKKSAAPRPVLLVPSLINKASILDIAPHYSLAEALAAAGHTVYLLDWGTPDATERGYDAARYVTDRLLPALQGVVAAHAQAPALFGYCMGGVLALAAAQLRPSQVASLALLACPWDFAAGPLRMQPLLPHQLAQLQDWLAQQTTVQPATLEHWFYLQNPWAVHAKFRQLSAMPPEAESTQAFLAAEDWLHDGVPLTREVAQNGWVDWGHHNALLHGRWVVEGQAITPARVPHATLVICPQEDTIVPPACSKPLAKLLPHATLHTPATGHIGALVGKDRAHHLWQPVIADAALQ